jgi:hypothetical protein
MSIQEVQELTSETIFPEVEPVESAPEIRECIAILLRVDVDRRRKAAVVLYAWSREPVRWLRGD